MPRKGRLCIGTSGFAYSHWRSVFYPQKLSPRDWFKYYVTKFSCVEINVSFYRLPDRSVWEGWAEAAPDDFLFCVKGSRIVTHIRRLKGVRQHLNRFHESIAPIKEKLGAILWQLPPTLRYNKSLLTSFMRELSRFKGVRHAIEFRHKSWWRSDVKTLLSEEDIAFVVPSGMRDLPDDLIVTASFAYLRMHGYDTTYSGRYPKSELKRLAGIIHEAKILEQGRDVFIFFNNDAHGHAVINALELLYAFYLVRADLT